MIEPRPYQQENIDDIRAHFRAGVRSVLWQSPTGSGKSTATAYVVAHAKRRETRTMFLCHRDELLKQVSEAFMLQDIDHSYIAAGYPYNRNSRVHICTVGTLARRLHKVPRPDFVIWEEAHHIAARTWAAIFLAFGDARHLLLSATPYRLDGKGLANFAHVMVRGPSVRWLIDHGYLSEFKIYAPPAGFSLEGVHTRAGDYAKDELASVVDKPTITGDVLSHYQKLAPGQRFLMRGVSIQHSEHLAAQFNAAGIPCVHMDGTTSPDVRRMHMRDFRDGRLLGISNVDLFSEGLDCPGIECLIDVRPTQSLTLAMQFWGRGLRPSEGKSHVTILDHPCNAGRFGLPDEEREWRLEGDATHERKRGDTVPRIRQCGFCYAANKATAKVCVECGTAFPIKPRVVRETDGELTEIRQAEAQRNRQERLREEGAARTLEDWLAIARARGYAPQWAYIRHNMRRRRA